MNGGFEEAVGPWEGARTCPACGARVRREAARFCQTCGRDLVRGGDYFPSDTLRASYHMQRARGRDGADRAPGWADVGAGRESGRADVDAGAGRAGASRSDAYVPRPSGRTHVSRRRPMPPPAPRSLDADAASASARAFVTYSLVPYLGILFCPGALVAGGLGLARARRSPRPGCARSSAAVLGLGIAVTGAQVFLWWILYKVPDWVGKF